MNINYNNINELINLLHEFVYESKNDTYNNYTYQSLNPSTIKINQLVNILKFSISWVKFSSIGCAFLLKLFSMLIK